MKPRILDAFRYQTAVSNRDRDWETLIAWNRLGWLRLVPNPDAKGHAMAELTDKGRAEVGARA